jgi:phytoene desaturase
VADKTVIVIGSGFAGLSAASFMAKQGWKVTVLEKNSMPGGRACQLKDRGFTFDMGPSFYWMPDVFERFFNQFGKTTSQYYSLDRLDPSYRIYWKDGYTDLPANYSSLKEVFETIEPDSAVKLEKYLQEAAYKYEIGVQKMAFKPGLSVWEFIDWDVMKGVFKLDVFTSVKKHIYRYFSHPRLRQMMEFPVLFLGALPEATPAMYSLMNFADIKGGTWYPRGGMYAVVQGMYELATELGVSFRFNEEVKQIVVDNGIAQNVITDKQIYRAGAVISGADYHFTETKLLPFQYRSYSASYWQKRLMAPSCLLYYVGLNKKLRNVQHHSLFFDASLDDHGREIYKEPGWPADPLFYTSIASVTDPATAPAGCENIVFLIPVASGLEGETDELKEKYFQLIVCRMERHTGQSILDSVIYKRMYAPGDFKKDYNSFQGNAYGLANTLRQTSLLKPSCRSRKVKNLFYTGQLTVPGPGVPPSLISGEVVSTELNQLLS